MKPPRTQSYTEKRNYFALSATSAVKNVEHKIEESLKTPPDSSIAEDGPSGS